VEFLTDRKILEIEHPYLAALANQVPDKAAGFAASSDMLSLPSQGCDKGVYAPI
jgi:hypothetical protein